jgi:hypothetical protein
MDAVVSPDSRDEARPAANRAATPNAQRAGRLRLAKRRRVLNVSTSLVWAVYSIGKSLSGDCNTPEDGQKPPFDRRNSRKI